MIDILQIILPWLLIHPDLLTKPDNNRVHNLPNPRHLLGEILAKPILNNFHIDPLRLRISHSHLVCQEYRKDIRNIAFRLDLPLPTPLDNAINNLLSMLYNEISLQVDDLFCLP